MHSTLRSEKLKTEKFTRGIKSQRGHTGALIQQSPHVALLLYSALDRSPPCRRTVPESLPSHQLLCAPPLPRPHRRAKTPMLWLWLSPCVFSGTSFSFLSPLRNKSKTSYAAVSWNGVAGTALISTGAAPWKRSAGAHFLSPSQLASRTTCSGPQLLSPFPKTPLVDAGPPE